MGRMYADLLRTMRAEAERIRTPDSIVDRKTSVAFADRLIVLTLLSMPTPRSQIIKTMCLGTTFVMQPATGEYRITSDGRANSKTFAPLLLVVNKDVSGACVGKLACVLLLVVVVVADCVSLSQIYTLCTSR